MLLGAVREAARAFLYLAVGAAVSLSCYLMAGLFLLGVVSIATVVGAGVLPEVVLTLRRIAGFELNRTVRRVGVPPDDPGYAPFPDASALVRLRAAVTDPTAHRDLRWALAQLFCGLLLFYVSMVLWPLGLLVDAVCCLLLRRRAVLLPVIGVLADLQAALARSLLRPPAGARMAERIEELAATRVGAVAAHGAELRRIERDLHDGAQAHLVALSMRIGLARRARPGDPETAGRLLAEAQDQAEEALAALRRVVRGIHPPVLSDRGLAGAVRALAAASGLRVAVATDGIEDASGPAAGGEAEAAYGSTTGRRPGADVPDGPGTGPGDGTADRSGGGRPAPRAPAAYEAAAYFAVAEALTNAAKHGGGRHARVELARRGRALLVTVRDDGRGGAEESGGSGLAGIRRRVAALDGTVSLSSPAGGPTVVEVEFPCAW